MFQGRDTQGRLGNLGPYWGPLPTQAWYLIFPRQTQSHLCFFLFLITSPSTHTHTHWYIFKVTLLRLWVAYRLGSYPTCLHYQASVMFLDRVCFPSGRWKTFAVLISYLGRKLTTSPSGIHISLFNHHYPRDILHRIAHGVSHDHLHQNPLGLPISQVDFQALPTLTESDSLKNFQCSRYNVVLYSIM